MKYKLFNFDHGLSLPEKINIGLFNISITNQHCKNIKLMPKNEQKTYTYDISEGNLKRIIKTTPKRKGSWVETALVEINPENIKPSILYLEETKQNNIDDLCLLLSFLSGRRVSYEDDKNIDNYNPEQHVDRIVYPSYFRSSLFNWKNLENIVKNGLGPQFYNLTLAYESKELIAKAAYCNTAFNVIYNKWCKENKLEFIETKTYNKIKNKILECLEEDGVAETYKEDICRRVNNLNSPSSIIKIKHFLKGIELYPEDNEDAHKRLKWFSSVRNAFSHSGYLPNYGNFSTLMRMEICDSIISLILRIVQYYFATRILAISDPYLEFIRKEISRYFMKGVFSEKYIFNETYEESMERTAKNWLEKGY
jgi:hypothetical protein